MENFGGTGRDLSQILNQGRNAKSSTFYEPIEMDEKSDEPHSKLVIPLLFRESE